MRPLFSRSSENDGTGSSYSDDQQPEIGAALALRVIPPAISELKPSTLYGLEPQELAGYEKWFVVHRIGLAEQQAGAQLQDMGIVCLLPGKTELIDSNLSFKARPNFRGVYVSQASRLKCYYFNPSYVKKESPLPNAIFA
jgi:hypothetical protein